MGRIEDTLQILKGNKKDNLYNESNRISEQEYKKIYKDKKCISKWRSSNKMSIFSIRNNNEKMDEKSIKLG